MTKVRKKCYNKKGDEMKKKPYIIALFFFLIDLISKLIISNKLSLGQSKQIIHNFFYITYAKNKGAAWSILEDQRILLLIVTVISLFLINKYMNKENLSKIEEYIYGLIIGGIIGNLFDRIFNGGVIDFFDFKIFGYDYPIFNLADTFIVIGIILLIITNMRKEYHGKNYHRRCECKN